MIELILSLWNKLKFALGKNPYIEQTNFFAYHQFIPENYNTFESSAIADRSLMFFFLGRALFPFPGARMIA